MFRSIYSHISDSIDDRSTNIINHVASHNKNYSILTSKILELQNEIFKHLPENYQTLLLDYEILLGERDSLKNLILYKQGIIDGIKVKNLISIRSGQMCPIIKGEI